MLVVAARVEDAWMELTASSLVHLIEDGGGNGLGKEPVSACIACEFFAATDCPWRALMPYSNYAAIHPPHVLSDDTHHRGAV